MAETHRANTNRAGVLDVGPGYGTLIRP